MRISRIAVAAATLVISIGVCFFVVGQGPKVGTSGSAPPPKRTGKGPVKQVIYVKKESVTATTGSLSVAAEPNANLLVEPLNIPGAEGKEAVVPKGERIFIFNGLKPGEYRVAGTLAGHVPNEKRVTIKKSEGSKLTLDFEPILFTAIIKTNLPSGELKYGEEGQPLNRVASIQNGKVQLRLPAAKYFFEIKPGEGQSGFEVLSDTFSLTKDETFPFNLKSLESTETLNITTWTRAELQGWDVPSGWEADSKKTLRVKGAGVGLPREARYRNYKDFRLESYVKVTNGDAISFALRARDAQNYYLLQLTGEKSDEPYVVRLFAVTNGVARRLRVITIAKSKFGAMASGQFFNVYIKMIGYDITVEIDGEGGIPDPLGKLTDSDHSFPIGAVGIAARDNENSAVERFVVCTGKCLQQ